MRPGSPRPFYEVPGADGRRLLLISYHFPPGRSAGSLRWQKLARFVAERGWLLDVVTLDPSGLSAPDPGRLEELPPGTRVFGVPERPSVPERLHAGLRRMVRRSRSVAGRLRPGSRTAPGGAGSPASNGGPARPLPGVMRTEGLRWMVRTPRELQRAWNAWTFMTGLKGWGRRVEALSSRILDARHHAIVTCGPPHIEHDAGRRLAARTGLPHVMDYRDAWSGGDTMPEPVASRVWLRIHTRDERRAIHAADLVVANTELLRAALAKQFPAVRDRIVTVTNGYDEDHPPAPRAPDGPFIVAYAGSIYLDRDPRPLFRAAARVVAELGLDPSAFRIEFMGQAAEYGGVSTARLAAESGLDGYFTAHPSGSHEAMRAFLARAPMLVSLPQDASAAVPSKIFEYMQYDAWLLVFAKPGTAPAVLLRDTAADVVDPDDEEHLVRVLRDRVLLHRRGEKPPRLAGDERFSRRHQAGLLVDALERTMERRPAPSASPREAYA